MFTASNTIFNYTCHHELYSTVGLPHHTSPSELIKPIEQSTAIAKFMWEVHACQGERGKSVKGDKTGVFFIQNQIWTIVGVNKLLIPTTNSNLILRKQIKPCSTTGDQVNGTDLWILKTNKRRHRRQRNISKNNNLRLSKQLRLLFLFQSPEKYIHINIKMSPPPLPAGIIQLRETPQLKCLVWLKSYLPGWVSTKGGPLNVFAFFGMIIWMANGQYLYTWIERNNTPLLGRVICPTWKSLILPVFSRRRVLRLNYSRRINYKSFRGG